MADASSAAQTGRLRLHGFNCLDDYYSSHIMEESPLLTSEKENEVLEAWSRRTS